MRTSELKAGERYADCNGELVVPVEPVRNDWYWNVEKVDGKDQSVARNGDVQDDPWATCSRSSRSRIRKGVLVEVYHFDSAGRRVGESIGQQIIPARDIKGTWNEYVVLHTEDVERRAKARKKKEKADALQKELRELAKGVTVGGCGISVNTSGGYINRWNGDVAPVEATIQFTIDGSSRMDAKQARKVLDTLRSLSD